MLVLLPGMALGSLLTLFWQQKFRICLMKKGDSEDKPGRDVNGRMECDGRLSASGPIHVPLELEIRSSSCVGEVQFTLQKECQNTATPSSKNNESLNGNDCLLRKKQKLKDTETIPTSSGPFFGPD